MPCVRAPERRHPALPLRLPGLQARTLGVIQSKQSTSAKIEGHHELCRNGSSPRQLRSSEGQIRTGQGPKPYYGEQGTARTRPAYAIPSTRRTGQVVRTRNEELSEQRSRFTRKPQRSESGQRGKARTTDARLKTQNLLRRARAPQTTQHLMYRIVAHERGEGD